MFNWAIKKRTAALMEYNRELERKIELEKSLLTLETCRTKMVQIGLEMETIKKDLIFLGGK